MIKLIKVSIDVLVNSMFSAKTFYWLIITFTVNSLYIDVVATSSRFPQKAENNVRSKV